YLHLQPACRTLVEQVPFRIAAQRNRRKTPARRGTTTLPARIAQTIVCQSFDRCRDWGLQALVCGGRDRRAGTAIIFSVLGESCSNVQPSPGRFRLREPNFTLDKAIVRLPLLALAPTSLFFDIEINLCCGAV